MSGSTRAIGGGPATGLADQWITMLQQLLNGGGTGTAGSPDPTGSTTNIMNVLTDILAGGKGQAGGAISELLSKQSERDVAGIRARYGAQGGVAFGTPAAFAESLYRSEAAPRITSAITGLQLQTILPLLSAVTQLSGLGIPQRQLVHQKGFLSEALGTLAPVAQALTPFLVKPFGGGGGGIDIAKIARGIDLNPVSGFPVPDDNVPLRPVSL